MINMVRKVQSSKISFKVIKMEEASILLISLVSDKEKMKSMNMKKRLKSHHHLLFPFTFLQNNYFLEPKSLILIQNKQFVLIVEALEQILKKTSKSATNAKEEECIWKQYKLHQDSSNSLKSYAQYAMERAKSLNQSVTLVMDKKFIKNLLFIKLIFLKQKTKETKLIYLEKPKNTQTKPQLT